MLKNSPILPLNLFFSRPASRWQPRSTLAPVPCTWTWPTCRRQQQGAAWREAWAELLPSARPPCPPPLARGWAPWPTRPAARQQPSWPSGSSWRRPCWRSLPPNLRRRSSTSCPLLPTASSSTWWAWRRWCRACWTVRVSKGRLYDESTHGDIPWALLGVVCR